MQLIWKVSRKRGKLRPIMFTFLLTVFIVICAFILYLKLMVLYEQTHCKMVLVHNFYEAILFIFNNKQIICTKFHRPNSSFLSPILLSIDGYTDRFRMLSRIYVQVVILDEYFDISVETSHQLIPVPALCMEKTGNLYMGLSLKVFI